MFVHKQWLCCIRFGKFDLVKYSDVSDTLAITYMKFIEIVTIFSKFDNYLTSDSHQVSHQK